MDVPVLFVDVYVWVYYRQIALGLVVDSDVSEAFLPVSSHIVYGE